MAALGSLVVSLEANTAQFTAGMDKAAYQTDKAMKQMQREAQAVGAAMGAMAVVGAGALAMLVKGAIDAADSLRDQAQQTGIAIETLNGLGFAASQAGGNLQSMVAAAGKLNKSIAEAARGNDKVGEAFKVLGINVEDASGKLKKSDVVMAEVADQFASFEDGPEKVALALRLFGKAGVDMIPVLNEGGDAMRENIAYAQRYSGMTTELANASDNFNDTMGKLKIQQQGFANTLTAAVLPILQAVASEILVAKENSDKFSLASAVARDVLQTMALTAAGAAVGFKLAGDALGLMLAANAQMLRGNFSGLRGMGDAAKESWSGAIAEFSRFKDAVMAAPSGTSFGGIKDSERGSWDTKKPAPRLPDGGTPAGPKGKDPDADFKAYMKHLENQISKVRELTVVEKLLADIKSGSLTVSAVQEDRLAGIAKEIDATKEAIRVSDERAARRRKDDADAITAIRQIEAEKAQETQRNEANVQQIRTSLLDGLSQEILAYGLRMQELQKFHDSRAENVRLANELMEAETARHEQAKTELQAANQLSSLSMAGNAASQLYGLMEKSGREQSTLGKALFLASKAIAVAEIILNTEVAAAKAGAQLGIFGLPMATMIRITGYASAGMVAGMAIAGAREKGGAVWPGGAFMVGEKGPEIFKPTGSGSIIPNNQLGGAGGGDMKLTIVNNTRAPIGKVTEQRMSGGERALIIEEAVAATAAQLSDPNSRTSRSMGRNFAVARSR